MKKHLKITAISLVVLITLFSCSDPVPPATFLETDSYGTYTGKHSIVGLVEIKDTLDVTDNIATTNTTDGQISLYSHVLGASFSATLSGTNLTLASTSFDTVPLPGTNDSILSATGFGNGKFNGNKLTFTLNVNATTTLDSPFDDLNAPVTGTFTK